MKQIRLKKEIYIIEKCGDFGGCPYWNSDDCRCGYDWDILQTTGDFPEDCPLEDTDIGYFRIKCNYNPYMMCPCRTLDGDCNSNDNNCVYAEKCMVGKS